MDKKIVVKTNSAHQGERYLFFIGCKVLT